eukprot:SAG31_NODE_2349_length_5893_cov_3.376251_3_plen_71_part_00
MRLPFNSGNTQMALHDYSCALDNDPNNLAAWVNRGVLRVQLTQFATAIADFDGALQVEQRCADPCFLSQQ